MAASFLQASFSKGEISPELYGHVDLALWHTALSTCRNMFVSYKGGAFSRAGTKYVGRAIDNASGLPSRLLTWSFTNQQAYALEFGANYLRFLFQGGYVLENPFNIGGVGLADPCTITTTTPHNYSSGDWVAIAGVFGPIMLNGNNYIVGTVISATEFTITDLDNNPIDARAFPAWVIGGTVARVYTIPSPYPLADLQYIKTTQSADVMSLTCANPNGGSYPPYDLTRLGPANWTLLPTNFGSVIQAPSACAAIATVQPSGATMPPTLPCAYAYQVTAIDQKTGQESQPSPVANITNGVDMAATNGSNVVTWSTVQNAAYYNIYRSPTSYNTQPGNSANALPVPVGAIFGLVGQAFGNQFVDNNITPETRSPPQHRNPFAPGQILYIQMLSSSNDWTSCTPTINTSTGSGFVGEAVIINGTIVAIIVVNPGQNYNPMTDSVNFGAGTGGGAGSSATGMITFGPSTGTYPAVVSYFQERRSYFQSLNAPDSAWYSQPGAFTNFDSSIPVNDSDAISATIFAEKVDGIQWSLTMPLGQLTFTGSGVWQIGAPGSFASSPAAITPSNIIASPQSSIGCSPTVQPQRVNWDIIYLENYGSNVLDLSYQIFFNIYAGTDISWSSSHLLQNYGIFQWAYARNPNRVIWAVRNDGILLSLTYLKEQEVVGWARHDTLGQVRSVCVVSEPPVDAVYIIVERPLPDGSVRFFIERMDNRLWSSIEDTWAVDCGLGTAPIALDATLFASSGSGPVTFTTANPVLASVGVGQVIRMNGGIANITASISAYEVQGTWVYPCQQFYPNDPLNRPVPASPGTWTTSFQVNEVYLPHLIGQQVVGLADGVPVGPLTVGANGLVTLPFLASNIKLGLGFTAQAQSVYLETGQPTDQGRRKSIYAVTVRCQASAPCQVGTNQPDSAGLSPTPLFSSWPALPQGTTANISPTPPKTYTTPGGATAQPLFTGDYRVNVPSAWAKQGQVAVQQTLPLPLNVVSFIPEVLPGDIPEIQAQPRRAA